MKTTESTALSIRQPWAWLIIHGGKDIENRNWHAKFRGRFLVHAAKGMTRDEYESAAAFAQTIGVKVPPANELQRGGIIGSVELVDSVENHTSPWYMGDIGFVLKNPQPLPFVPIKGQLGFFDIPSDVIEQPINFQQRIQPWLLECFGPMIASDREERNHRFLEEALELVQSTGCTAIEAHRLVDYVYNRPVGEPAQEVGGCMVTLAALCLANNLDMHQAGETELARINQPDMVVKIRKKQATKPKHSPLPQAVNCQDCDDGEGGCIYPHTGLAPHTHVGQHMIGSTQFLDKSHYPANFSIDPDANGDANGVGTYTHCLNCGAPNNEVDVDLEQQIKYWQGSATGWAENYSRLQSETGRLVRELDIAINGEAGAAKQAMLCDIVAQAKQQELKAVPSAYGILPSELTPVIKSVLGMMCFKTSPYAHIYQAAGFDIPKKTEEEQAFILHRWLLLALLHGNDWPLIAQKEVEELRAKIKEASHD